MMLENQEQQKKAKYLKCCLEMRCYFTPFVYSVDAMGREGVIAAEKRLASHLRRKWEYSKMVGFVRAWMLVN